MARPLKYGEKTSVRSITIPDSMWEAIPSPKSAWAVEAIRQMLVPERSYTPSPEGAPMPKQALAELTEEVKAQTAARLEVIQPPTEMTKEQIDLMFSDVPEPIRSEVPDGSCNHPKARQVNIIGGKKCLDCGATKKLNSGWAL